MRKRTRDSCSRVVQYGDAASLLAKLCPRGGRAAKQRRTVGRLAEVLAVSSLAGVRAWFEVDGVFDCLLFFVCAW